MNRKAERKMRDCGQAMQTQAPKMSHMWTNNSELAERDEEVAFLLDHGCYQQVVEESLAWLKHQPDNLHAVESLLRAQWRAGDTLGALRSVNWALRLYPHEPGYKYIRGLIRQSAGMIREAMEDFQEAASMATLPEFVENAAQAIQALEDWQIYLLRTLLEEDRLFKLEYSISPEEAVKKRGFALTNMGHRTLLHIYEHGMPQAAAAGVS